MARYHNGNIVFTRAPVELLGFYSMTERFRLGLGVRKSQSAKMRGSDFAAGLHETYDSTVGGVFEGQYFFSDPSKSERSPLFGMYMRYVKESYKAKNEAWDSEKRDGSHVVLGLMFYY